MTPHMETTSTLGRVMCIDVPRPDVAELAGRLTALDLDVIRRPISAGLRDPRPVLAVWVDGRSWLDVVALHARFPGCPMFVLHLPQTDGNPVAKALLSEIDIRLGVDAASVAQALGSTRTSAAQQTPASC